ncbi:MAG: hypothetical protein ACRC1F_00035, partial [Metamycoplasmataceae bacterium]
MSKKVLIFGNGISLRYTNGEYDYESLIKKFNHGFEWDQKFEEKRELVKKNFSGDYYDQEKKLLDSYSKFTENENEFNEKYFFEIYKLLFELEFENHKKRIETLQEFENPDKLWDECYKIIKNKEESPIMASVYLSYFQSSYWKMRYGICRAVALDIDFKNWIKIFYSDAFIENIVTYDNIYTTNYYTDNLEDHVKHVKIEYLHGNVDIKFKNLCEGGRFSRIATEGDEFYPSTNLLFGGEYQDKVFLNSIINCREELKEIKPSETFDFVDCEVDIVGLSTEGDIDIIKKVMSQAKKVTIYYHFDDKNPDNKENLDNKKSWEELIANEESKNCQMLPDTKYPGFVDEVISMP